MGATSASAQTSFGNDVAFLRAHTEIVELSDVSGEARVAIAPAWQGRVMTSTAENGSGASYGWINRSHISSRQISSHINVFGGEDRFWIGPEGGQYSIFFAKGASFDLDHWYVPAALDTLPFQIVARQRDRAEFESTFGLSNFIGTKFDLKVNRVVQLLDRATLQKALGLRSSVGVKIVGYESRNRLTNIGSTPWKKETGLLSIWILGMFAPSPSATIIIPLRNPVGPAASGVTTDYFGTIPAERLSVADDALLMRADGKFRSKVGVKPGRSTGVLGSYDPIRHLLTIVQFDPPKADDAYVSSLWKFQDSPFTGDAANAYNDGPPAPGAKPLGPFYELESSSPSTELAAGASIEHRHRTIHISGSRAVLVRVARTVLGLSLKRISSFSQR